MARTHRVVIGARIRSTAAAHDAGQQAVGGAQAIILAGLLVGFPEGRHEPPDREIAARQFRERLGAGPAFAGTLGPGDQRALALLREFVEPELGEHLPADTPGDRGLASLDFRFLRRARRVEVERRHLGEPSFGEGYRAARCNLVASERVQVGAPQPVLQKMSLAVGLAEQVRGFLAEVGRQDTL
jgi:hypothetical protein